MKWSILILTLLSMTSCQRQATYIPPSSLKAKNIILLIGDGMGIAQLSTSYYYGDETPSFSSFPQVGLHQPKPVGSLITDSAAGATAFSTGYETYNDAVGVDRDTLPRKTILELAAQNGKATGIVVTSPITHATPAAFYAHSKNRDLTEDIALDLMAAPLNYIAGGGTEYLTNRADNRNLLQELGNRRGTTISSDISTPPPFELGGQYIALVAPDALLSMKEGRGDFLPKTTKGAIEYLSQNKDGFFLMVEGSQIDWGGHGQDSEYIINEVSDFEKTVRVALEFAARDGNTLVIVTADHETGGFSLSAPIDSTTNKPDYRFLLPTFSTIGHSATLIPVLAYGPGAERFSGIYPNNTVFSKMVKSFGFPK